MKDNINETVIGMVKIKYGETEETKRRIELPLYEGNYIKLPNGNTAKLSDSRYNMHYALYKEKKAEQQMREREEQNRKLHTANTIATADTNASPSTTEETSIEGEPAEPTAVKITDAATEEEPKTERTEGEPVKSEEAPVEEDEETVPAIILPSIDKENYIKEIFSENAETTKKAEEESLRRAEESRLAHLKEIAEKEQREKQALEEAADKDLPPIVKRAIEDLTAKTDLDTMPQPDEEDDQLPINDDADIEDRPGNDKKDDSNDYYDSDVDDAEEDNEYNEDDDIGYEESFRDKLTIKNILKWVGIGIGGIIILFGIVGMFLPSASGEGNNAPQNDNPPVVQQPEPDEPSITVAVLTVDVAKGVQITEGSFASATIKSSDYESLNNVVYISATGEEYNNPAVLWSEANTYVGQYATRDLKANETLRSKDISVEPITADSYVANIGDSNVKVDPSETVSARVQIVAVVKQDGSEDVTIPLSEFVLEDSSLVDFYSGEGSSILNSLIKTEGTE